jgi:sulfur carrier protein ThiS
LNVPAIPHLTLADLIAFAEAEGHDPVEVRIVVAVNGAVVPATVRSGERGVDRMFVVERLI